MRAWVDSLCAGPFGDWLDQSRAAARQSTCAGIVWEMACSGFRARRGGFVPCEVTYPARLSTHARMSAAGPRVTPCPCPFASEEEACRPSVRTDKTRSVTITLAPTAGLEPLFHSGGHSSLPG